MPSKAFSEERIEWCLGHVSKWRESGMSVFDYAPRHELKVNDLRAWVCNERRWLVRLGRLPKNDGAGGADQAGFVRALPDRTWVDLNDSQRVPLQLECNGLKVQVSWPLSQINLSAAWPLAMWS